MKGLANGNVPPRRKAMSTIEHYRDQNLRPSFPIPPEFYALFDDFFQPSDCRFTAYETGDRCPIVGYRIRARAKSRPGMS